MSRSRKKAKRIKKRLPPTEYAAQGSANRPMRSYQNYIAPPSESRPMTENYTTSSRASSQPLQSYQNFIAPPSPSAVMAQNYVVENLIPTKKVTINAPSSQSVTSLGVAPYGKRSAAVPVFFSSDDFEDLESTQSEISNLSNRSRAFSFSSMRSQDFNTEGEDDTRSISSFASSLPSLEMANRFVPIQIDEEEEEDMQSPEIYMGRPMSRDLNREEVSRISSTVSPFSFTDESIRSSTTESSAIPIRSPENIDTRASISESILASDSQNEKEARLGVGDVDIGGNRLNYGPVQRQIQDISNKIRELTSKGEELNNKMEILEENAASYEDLIRVNNQMKDVYTKVEQAKNFKRFLQDHFEGRIDLFSEPYQGSLMREIERAPTNYEMQLAELLGQDVSTIQSSRAMGETTLKYQYPDASQTDNECFQISIKGDMITVDHLKYPEGQTNCKEPGPKLLNALKAFAEKTNKRLQIGIDASSVKLDSGLKISMAPYKILTKGQSWYNSQGFINEEEHEKNVRANKKLLDMELSKAIDKAEKILGNNLFVPTFVERMIMREPDVKVKALVDKLKNLVADQAQTGRDTRLSVKEDIKDILKLLSPLVQYRSDSLVYVPNSESFYETYN